MSFRENFDRSYILAPGTSHRARLKHALLSTGRDGHQPTWERIESCSKGRWCDSSYCNDCRTRLCRAHASKVMKLHQSLHGDDEGLARNNIRFVTVLHNLAVIDPKGAGLYDDFSDVKRSVLSLKRGLARVRRAFPGLVMSGRVELEAINVEHVLASDSCPRKTSVVREFTKSNKGSNKVMILVHAHFLLFLNGNDFNDVKAYMNNKWSGSYLTKFDSLYSKQSVKDSIRKICFYSTKDRYTYNHKMDTDGYRYGSLLSNDVLSYLVRVSLSIGSSGLNIWTKKGKILDTIDGAGSRNLKE